MVCAGVTCGSIFIALCMCNYVDASAEISKTSESSRDEKGCRVVFQAFAWNFCPSSMLVCLFFLFSAFACKSQCREDDEDEESLELLQCFVLMSKAKKNHSPDVNESK
jgi:hypothetical protein